MQIKSKIAIGSVVVVGALAAFFVYKSVSGQDYKSELVGNYTHKDGSTVEFLSDGTAIFRKDGSQRMWKYSFTDNGSLKLETAAPVVGVEPAMCNYRRTPKVFEVFGCQYAMTLNVVQ
ncbi:hypothetical protein [Agrobacterium sp. T29]|uniref:hypothetical protein n=1 Tax=Agrobacterium sp. T29 TaxID=2580515 RepID=UPI00115C4BBB|nr:hypothetical protein [Agrobacterium sp. T29]